MKKKRVFTLAVLMFICATLFSCCSFFAPLKLSKPLLFHNQNAQTISWNVVDNAQSYEVYVNEQLTKKLSQPVNSMKVVFEYGEVLVNDGSYIVKVRALGNEKYTDSEFSNLISVIIGEQGNVDVINKNVFDENVVENSPKCPENLEVINNILSWVPEENAVSYVVGIFNNEDGLTYVSVDTNYLHLNDYFHGSETLFLRVGALYEDDAFTYFSEGEFFSPHSKNGFTSNYFVFDGGVYDYYIEDYEELQALYYYAFVQKLENFNFLVSQSFQSTFNEKYFRSDLIRNCFKETYAYSQVPTIAKLSNSNVLVAGLTETAYNVNCKFYNKQPVLDVNGNSKSTVTRKQNQMFTPYYEMSKLENRNEDFDSFVSDRNFLYTPVTSSDELFWAVQEGITPRFTNTNCRAYVIYNKAKQVLNDIIKVGMTDYEKVLSIYDWIMFNTTYDSQTEQQGTSVIPTEYPCYYLEGVFMDNLHLSVCDGFSKAFSLMCNMEGIDCVRITGSAGSGYTKGGHAWNKVKLDNNWYLVDITWSELISQEEDNSLLEIPIHSYFLVDYTDMVNTHTEFDGRAKYNLYTNDGYYSYYTHTHVTGDDNVDFFIESDAELTKLLKYCYENQFKAVDVMFSDEYLNYISINSSLTNKFIENKPNYGTMVPRHLSGEVPYNYYIRSTIFKEERIVETGQVYYLELGYFIKNQSTLNEWCKSVINNQITSFEQLDISIDTEFLKSLKDYDANKTITQNFEDIISANENFVLANKQIKLTLLKEKQEKEYTLANGEKSTYLFNTYKGVITDLTNTEIN